VTKKNAHTMTEKMTVNKYDPVVRKHVEYKEGEIKGILPDGTHRTEATQGLRGPFVLGM